MWLLCVGQIIIIADVCLILDLLGYVILMYFKFYLENYKNHSHSYPIIYVDFYPINKINLYLNSFSSNLMYKCI